MGTSGFACACLKEILDSAAAEVVAAFIKVETSHGRRKKDSPVKLLARERGITVFSHSTLRTPEAAADISTLRPDVVVVVDYGLLLPGSILGIPPQGCINLHASLLPRHRGAAPVQRAILGGDPVTGVTVMAMNEAMDAGDILMQEEEPIQRDDDAASLLEKLARRGAGLLVRCLRDMGSGRTVRRTSQDGSLVTLAPKVRKEEAVIRWDEEASLISRKIRAFVKWPGCMTKMKFRGENRLVKIYRAFPSEKVPAAVISPGTVLSVTAGAVDVQAGSGTVLSVEILQMEGRKAVSAGEFANGYHLEKGDRFFWSD
jgi:methionyl-tRNA formyltransferase